MTRLVTADDVCLAAENTIRAHLPALLEDLGLHHRDTLPEKFGKLPFKAFAKWDQVPTPEALEKATVPCGAISSPGLVEPPTRRGRDTHDATWRVAVAVFDRGGSYSVTSARVRQWAAIIRALLLDNPSLGGVADSLAWRGEEYRQITSREQMRTLGGCAVAFDVAVANVADLSVEVPIQTVRTSLSVRPTQE